MRSNKLGNSDLHVSSIGLGCVTFGREIDRDTAFAVMDRAMAAGITLFDTAEVYAAGRSEQIVGEWLAARGTRRQIVVATKVAGSLSYERVITSAEASLRRLQIDTIDLFQLHRWDPEIPLDETLAALDQLVQRGLVRYVGCSNYAAWQICKALWRQDVAGYAPFVAAQLNYSLAMRGIEDEHLPLCADQQLGVLAYSPLGAGFLTGKYAPGAPIPAGTRFDVVPGHEVGYFTTRNFAMLDLLRERATAWGTTMPQLALAWAFSRPGITSTLIGSRSPAHVDQALQAATLNLSSAQLAELSTLSDPQP
ncbi:MAG TPA: aldo/keto reductase [Roseiflexaceae bacterium]|nr:aldo/keto reductase [Roseiflexaceae bacterium]HMP38952.1 aldo/keto reductase [Roseiflexaceae bacterium]